MRSLDARKFSRGRHLGALTARIGGYRFAATRPIRPASIGDAAADGPLDGTSREED